MPMKDYVFARRDKRKRRVKGGFIIEKRKRWRDANSELIVEKEAVVSKIKVERGGRRGKGLYSGISLLQQLLGKD